MKISIPADYFYKGAPAETLEVNKEALDPIIPENAWDEHIAREIARIEDKQKREAT